MSQLIKAGRADGEEVEALRLRPLAPEPAAAPGADPRIAELEGRIARLEAERRQSEAAHAAALARERELARADMSAEFVRDDSAALAALEQSLAAASAALGERLAMLEPLALALCEKALEPIFAGTEDYADLLSRALERQLAELERGAVLAIAVSAEDFGDPDRLAALAGRLGAVEIARDAALDRGACRIELRLGRIELSIPEAWSALRRKLGEIAAAEANA